MDRYTIASVRRVLHALDADGELSVRWGAPGDLERLLDRDHAPLVRTWAEMHRRHGWEVWPEASYSVHGERGRIDLLAFHPGTGILEVAEMKTGLWDLQETLGRLDAKVRLARGVAAERGWDVRAVVGAVVIAEVEPPGGGWRITRCCSGVTRSAAEPRARSCAGLASEFAACWPSFPCQIPTTIARGGRGSETCAQRLVSLPDDSLRRSPAR